MMRGLTRREMLGHAARGAALIGMGSVTAFLTVKARATDAWAIDTTKCIDRKSVV